MIVSPIEGEAEPETGPIVVHDGSCAVSAAWLGRARLRRAAGPVTLVDVRDGWHPVLGRLRAAGLDFDGDLVVELGGRFHRGAEAMTVLGQITAPRGGPGRAMAWAFRSPARARLFFPLLRAAMKLARRRAGRKPKIADGA